jgi:hypothetical protein
LRQENIPKLNHHPVLYIFHKTPTKRAQCTGNWKTQMSKSQHRDMKQKGNSSPSKANSTTKDLNNRKEEEMSNIELQK